MVTIKPKDLQEGDSFRVADACNPEELVDAWHVLEVQHTTKTILEKERIVRTDVLASKVGGDPEVATHLILMPWVVLERLPAEGPVADPDNSSVIHSDGTVEGSPVLTATPAGRALCDGY